MPADLMAEKMERQLQEFERKRVGFEAEITKIHEDIKQLVDQIFKGIVEEINPCLEETDAIIESHVKEFRRLGERKKELHALREKLAPVFDLLRTTTTTTTS